MTDIVERLRERQKLKYMGNCKCGKCQLVHIDTVYEAADEIERLRKTLRAVYDWCGYDAPDHEEIEGVLAGEKNP